MPHKCHLLVDIWSPAKPSQQQKKISTFLPYRQEGYRHSVHYAQYKGDVSRLSISYLHLSVTPDSTSHLKQSLWVLDNPTGWVVGVDPGGQGDHVHGARVLQLRRLRPGQRGPGPEVRRQERLVFYRHLSTAELQCS